MSFTKIYQEKKDAFEERLKKIFAEVQDIPETLRKAMEYSLLDGGKRLRPVMLLETFRMFGGEPDENVVKFAVAVECIHTYSLIHDDLPCMDNDDFRRGKPTSHKAFGEGVAVLAGDALLNLAYEFMTEASYCSAETERFIKAASILAKHAGSRGMVAGQIADIEAGTSVSGDMLKYIFRRKTGDLVISACAAGAILGGASKEEITNILNFADYFAYAFQIKDDILDHKEKGDENTSFVTVYGLQRAIQTLGDSTQRAQKELTALQNRDTEFLKNLTVKFASRKE